MTLRSIVVAGLAINSAAFAFPGAVAGRRDARRSSPAARVRMADDSVPAAARQPWELGRFARQAWFFNGPRLGGGGGGGAAVATPPAATLWSVASDDGAIVWGSLDDVVMGGASRSSWAVARDAGGSAFGRFSGSVTTANNGGFAGARTRTLAPPRDVSRSVGVALRVRGDGQRYKFIVRDDVDWNGVAWTVSFDTAADGTFKDVRLPFASFVPTKFAKTVRGGAPLDTSAICAFQLTLSKFEYDDSLNPSFRPGSFCLDVEALGMY